MEDEGEFFGAGILETEVSNVSSTCIEIICRPGIIAKPNILGSLEFSSVKYSAHVPKNIKWYSFFVCSGRYYYLLLCT